MKTTINTGALELRGLYQRYVTEALMLAGLMHFAMIGAYQVYANITDTQIQFPTFPKDTIHILPPPPPWNDYTALPTPILPVGGKVSLGMPIPIPDAEINPDETIPTQKEMIAMMPGNEVGEPNGGAIYIMEGTKIDNEEAPEEFVPYEKRPIPIKQLYPLYPEVARRAGVEGTVYIKMWVTKEGKVKEAKIAGTTSDLFNQAALDAAVQWVFTPAIMNNGPVSVWVTVPFKFKLNNRN